jgi:hypothetical protein
MRHDGRDVSYKHLVLIIQSAFKVIQTFVRIELIEMDMFIIAGGSGILSCHNIIWLKFSIRVRLPSVPHSRMVFDRKVQYMIFRKYQKVSTETYSKNKIHHGDLIILLTIL